MTLTRCALLLAIVVVAADALPHTWKRNATLEHGDFKEKLTHNASRHPVPSLTAEEEQEFQKIMEQIGPISEISSESTADDIFEQNRQNGIADLMLEGDIFLSDGQLESMKNAVESNGTRTKRNAAQWQPKWADGIVYYEMSPEIQANTAKVSMINLALQYIQKRTCIKFEKSTTADNRIQIIKGAGCYSNIGMVWGVQPLSLPDGCGNLHGTIVHEFMHALGFWHTQSRDDRDNWITVNPANIALTPEQTESNFGKKEGETINYTPYEYGSAMHYPPNLWSKAGTLAFVPKWPNQLYAMGTRSITFYDMKMINDHYECHARCPAGSAPCANGGYPNPNNCAECVCPPGYGGGWCMRQPEGCFAQLTATTEWKTQFIQIGPNDQVVRNMFSYCTHWISAPAKTQIQVKMTVLNNPKCVYGCQINGFEIKLNDPKMSGIRVCCPSDLNKIYSGSLNPMPIITHNRQGYTSYYIQYRYVAAAG